MSSTIKFLGNPHMMLVEKNNLEVADVLQTGLDRERLWQRGASTRGHTCGRRPMCGRD